MTPSAGLARGFDFASPALCSIQQRFDSGQVLGSGSPKNVPGLSKLRLPPHMGVPVGVEIPLLINSIRENASIAPLIAC
jgi:hypothetical protein